jgi:hypothetical protein
MPGDPFQRVSVGDPHRPNAELHNALVQAAVRSRRGWRTGASPASLLKPEGLINVFNDSGSDVDAFNVLGIDDILWGPADNLPEFQFNAAFICVTPTKAFHTGTYVITSEPIPKDGIGRGWVTSWCPARVNMLLVDDDTADVADTSDYLESGPIGSAQLLWVGDDERPGGSTDPDVRWAIIRIGNGSLPAFPVTLSNADGDYGSNGTITPPAPPTQPNLTYTVHHAKTGRFIADDVAVWPARQYGHVSPATKGYCDLIGGVTFIVQHDEVIDAGECS